MYEQDPEIKIVINDESDDNLNAFYHDIWNSLGEMAQQRLGVLYSDGYFMSSENRPVRSITIILSLGIQLMLKITSPPKKNRITRCVYVEVCKFDLKQLKSGPCGKYIHFASK